MERNALRLPALILFGIYAVYGAVLTPLYQIISADLVLSDMILWDIVDFAWQLFEILGIGAAIGFLVHGIYRYTFKKCLPLYYLIGGALLFKYVSSIASVAIVLGYLDLTADFSGYLVSFLIEAGTLALVTLIGHKLITKLCERNEIRAGGAKALGEEFVPEGEFYPFHRPFSRKNALQRTAFWGMIIVLTMRWISTLISDITFGYMYYGFSAADIPVTLLYWLALIVVPCFFAYLLALGCIMLSERKKGDDTDGNT